MKHARYPLKLRERERERGVVDGEKEKNSGTGVGKWKCKVGEERGGGLKLATHFESRGQSN